MIFKFALRNVLRNKKRSFLTALTIFFAAIIVGMAQSWVNGMLGVYINNFTKYQTGHIRITTEEFTNREKFKPVDELVYDSDDLIKKIKKTKGIKSIRERIQFSILLGSSNTTTDALGIGINLNDNEFNLKNKLKSGKVTDSGIYIGHKLADKMGVKIGEDLLLATKTSEGGLNGIKLKIDGIFKLGMRYDKKCFFISLVDAKKLLKIRNSTTEIFIYLNKIKETDTIKTDIVKILPEGIVAETFKKQLGEFYTMIQNAKATYAFIEALIIFLASFAIINTMMMAIFERIREIGTLKAMGMTDMELFLNFTCEGAILGTAGGIFGAIVGSIIIIVISYFGINMTEQLQNVDMPVEYILRPVIEMKNLFIAVGISIIVPSLAAMIPARHVKKLMPAEALRK